MRKLSLGILAVLALIPALANADTYVVEACTSSPGSASDSGPMFWTADLNIGDVIFTQEQFDKIYEPCLAPPNKIDRCCRVTFEGGIASRTRGTYGIEKGILQTNYKVNRLIKVEKLD